MNVKNKGRLCDCGKPAYCKGKCRACHNTQYRQENEKLVRDAQKRWLKLHPRYQRDWARKQRSNCTPEQVEQALINQNNCCGICKEVFATTPCADHDHTTQRFRGLLCQACNLGLGMFNDSLTKLEAALAWLR